MLSPYLRYKSRSLVYCDRFVADASRRNQNSSGIPPDEISLIGADFGGMEEWRNFFKVEITPRDRPI